MTTSSSRFRFTSAAYGAAIAALLALPARGGPGEIRGGDRLAYALTGARVIAAPGKVFDSGIVVVRGGVIEAAGPSSSTAIPADARVIDLKGQTIHAAFLDPYVTIDRLAGKKPPAPRDEEEDSSGSATRARGGPPASNRANERVLDGLSIKDRVADTYRRLGFAVVAAVPSAGILRGAGVVVDLGDADSRVLAERFGQYVSLEPARITDFSAALRRSVYPGARMGAVALVRQSLLDALWLRDAEAAYASQPGTAAAGVGRGGGGAPSGRDGEGAGRLRSDRRALVPARRANRARDEAPGDVRRRRGRVSPEPAGRGPQAGPDPARRFSEAAPARDRG